MIITDGYFLEKIAEHSKTRLDCTASTKSYPPFEEKRATKPHNPTAKSDAIKVGALVMYFNDVPERFKASLKRKASKSLTIKGKNLSSIFVPDIGSGFAYGDCKGTSDALLFVFHNFNVIDGRVEMGAKLEIFVARGYSKDCKALYNAFADGELDGEVEIIRKRATEPLQTGVNPKSL